MHITLDTATLFDHNEKQESFQQPRKNLLHRASSSRAPGTAIWAPASTLPPHRAATPPHRAPVTNRTPASIANRAPASAADGTAALLAHWTPAAATNFQWTAATIPHWTAATTSYWTAADTPALYWAAVWARGAVPIVARGRRHGNLCVSTILEF